MNKNLVIEAQYWGSVAYFSLLTKYDNVYIERHENFVKSTYRNRCHIATPNGLLALSVPLKSGRDQRRIMDDVEILNIEKWQANHWKSLCYAYRRTPYFEFYEDDLQPYFTHKFNSLLTLNLATTKAIIDVLGLGVTLNLSENYIEKDNESVDDFRSKIHPKKGVKVESWDEKEYHQIFIDKHGFIPNLSILDLLFNEGPNSIEFLQ